jgi:DNA polymerase-4
MAQPTSKVFPDRMVFHVDMDAFFAAVEQFENPALRGKPVIVGGVDSNRGVVSSASYEARVFGIHSAMPVAHARKRCPHGIYVPGRHDVYHAYSRRIMDCLSEFSPLIEQVSVDEAFLEMSGSEGLFGPPEISGARIKARIKSLIGLTASLGAAENKFLAKLASDVNKPDGLTIVRPGEAQAFLDPLPVGRLWGVGKKTVQELHKFGLYTIAQLRAHGPESLTSYFGDNFASHLLSLSHGRDDREVETEWREKSISHEMTFETDSDDAEMLLSVLLELSDRVARRARKEGLMGRTVSLVWRNPDFSRQSHARSLPEATHSSRALYETAADLFKEVVGPRGAGKSGKIGRKFRLMGVRLSNFAQESQQLSLFQLPKTSDRAGLDSAMDAVRDKFGEEAIKRARLADFEP